MYERKLWTRDAVLRMRESDVPFLRQEARWVKDDQVVQWCDEALAEVVSRQEARRVKAQARRERQAAKQRAHNRRVADGLVPCLIDVSSYERQGETCIVEVSDYQRIAWVRDQQGATL